MNTEIYEPQSRSVSAFAQGEPTDEELLARIHALLRRCPPRVELLEIESLAIDRAARRVTVLGQEVELSAKEFALVVKLASDPDRVFTREQLLRDVWGFRTYVPTRTLESHASRVRRKLAAASARLPIKKAVLLSMLPKSMSMLDRFKLAVECGFEQIECPTTEDPGQAEEIKRARRAPLTSPVAPPAMTTPPASAAVSRSWRDPRDRRPVRGGSGAGTPSRRCAWCRHSGA